MGRIEFKNVTFSYPMRPDIPVLKNISFRINKGEKIAFVGASGSGKSTILQLLQRFYEISEGQIMINGEDLQKLKKKSIRGHFGVVSQEPVLFNESFKYNIKYNTDSATDDEIRNAAEMANALDFILNQESFSLLNNFRFQ